MSAENQEHIYMNLPDMENRVPSNYDEETVPTENPSSIQDSRVPGALASSPNNTKQSFISPTSASKLDPIDEPTHNLSGQTYLPTVVTFPIYKCYPTEESVPMSHSRHIMNVPESNRGALLSSLKNLQEKIHQLEKEKVNAMGNLRNVSADATRRRFQTNRKDLTTERETTNEISDLTSKLVNAEGRCKSLDKYLDDLKDNFEDYFGISFEEVSPVSRPPPNRKQRSAGRMSQGFISEKARLNNMRDNTEKTIRELETRLQQARRYRQMIDERTNKLSFTQPGLQPGIGRPILHSSPYSEDPNVLLPPDSTLPTQSLTESNVTIDCVLAQLQEEFSNMQSHREDIQRLLLTPTNSELSSGIQNELVDIKLKMNIKVDQINKITQIQKLMEGLKQSKERSPPTHVTTPLQWSPAHACSKTAAIPLCEDDRKVQILTTITTCGRATLQTQCLNCEES